MTNITGFTFLSTDGKTQLHGMRWEPEGRSVRAVLQICHGVAEHIARYDAFARYLNELGIAVVGHDHLGHGRSLPEGGTPVYFGEGNTWHTVVDDIYVLHQRIRLWYPDVPLCIMGHSMGSFLLRTYLYTYPDAVDKAVISGTGWEDPTKVRLGKLVCKLEQARVGETSTSKLVTKLMFGSYNKPFGAVTSPNAWICSDEAVVAAYDADPLCGFDATVGLARDLLTGVEMNEQPENLDKMNKQLPLLFVSGSKDPVGGMAKGVLRCIDAFKRSGMKDITIKLYPEGRHEMLNERNKAEVYQDILDWLER